jgi:hypothetical protein
MKTTDEASMLELDQSSRKHPGSSGSVKSGLAPNHDALPGKEEHTSATGGAGMAENRNDDDSTVYPTGVNMVLTTVALLLAALVAGLVSCYSETNQRLTTNFSQGSYNCCYRNPKDHN